MSASYVSFRRSENKLKQARLQVAMGRIGFANNGPNLHHPFLCESAQTDTRNRPPYQMPRGLRVTRHGTGKFCFSKKKKFRKCTAAMRFTSEAGGDARARKPASNIYAGCTQIPKTTPCARRNRTDFSSGHAGLATHTDLIFKENPAPRPSLGSAAVEVAAVDSFDDIDSFSLDFDLAACRRVLRRLRRRR
jgi:hypothetical protein